MANFSKTKFGLAQLKVEISYFAVYMNIFYLHLTLIAAMIFQVFLFILSSPIILISFSGEGNFMGSTMISNVFHFSAVQHLNYFFKLERNQTSSIAMIGRLLLLYDNFTCFLSMYIPFS